ncbi:MAG: hypothetical protein IT320_16740 [Anaerolineae bacterium]|nr:hypothetical protein [Anaerolineae bacterium]
MSRKIVIITIIAVLLLSAHSAFAGNPSLPGCYVDAPTDVDEGATFTVTVTCKTLVAAYGFEYGTTLTGDGVADDSSYTPGTFTTDASGGVLVGSNALNLYAVSRQGLNSATGDFTMGSYSATADIGLTSDGGVSVTLDDFKLSTILGVPILGMVQAEADATIVINNINLALLTGNITLASDGSVGAISDVALNLGGVDYNQSSAAADHYDFTVAAGVQFPSLSVDVAADIDGHLACTKTYSLADGPNAAASAIGTITLKAGDVVSVASDTAINIQDATAVGSQFGSSSPTGEVDINQDGVVDIYDLVHVGRNYGTSQGQCA